MRIINDPDFRCPAHSLDLILGVKRRAASWCREMPSVSSVEDPPVGIVQSWSFPPHQFIVTANIEVNDLPSMLLQERTYQSKKAQWPTGASGAFRKVALVDSFKL